jgi:tRNA(fMet)-specific endonuclease VapC
MTHLLDTDTCIGVLRQRPGMVERLSQLSPTDCAVSMITVYELFCGVEKARDAAAERRKVERFVSTIVELTFDRAAAESAARIRADLQRQGQLIGPYDLLIAGQAVANNVILVTHNIHEFQRINGLKLESWVSKWKSRKPSANTPKNKASPKKPRRKTAWKRSRKSLSKRARRFTRRGESGIAPP